jgi:hypothetical protein
MSRSKAWWCWLYVTDAVCGAAIFTAFFWDSYGSHKWLLAIIGSACGVSLTEAYRQLKKERKRDEADGAGN